MSGLTEEQKRRMEENRRKALEKLASRKQAKTIATSSTSQAIGGKMRVDGNNNSNKTSSVQPLNNRTTNGTAHSTYKNPSSSFQTSSSALPSNTSRPSGQAVLPFYKNKESTSSTNSHSNSTTNHGKAGSSGFPPGQTSKPQLKEHKQQSLEKGRVSLSGKCVLISKERFKVDVGFNAQLIALFKTVNSRSYDAKTSTWNFHLEDYQELKKLIQPLAPAIDIKPLPASVVKSFLQPRSGTVKELSSQEISLKSIDEKLDQALMPFQRKGVEFGIKNDGRVLVADDMGLGKTIQSIAIACYYRAEWPLLVICPSSVKLTWKQAFCRWVTSLDPDDISIIRTGKDSLLEGKVVIVSYDLLPKKTNEIRSFQFRVVIADESHFLKNYKTARSKVILPILKGATRVTLLSGTPALSRPMELYTQISAIEPKLFPSFHDFGVRYCAGTQNRFGWDYSGASNMEELQLLLEHRIMIRRMKSEVLMELPAKRRQLVTLDPSLIKTKCLERAAKDAAKAKASDKHGALLEYFNETSTVKLPAIREYLLDHLEGGHKCLVFAHHKAVLDSICQWLYEKKIGHIRIDGSTPSEARQILCEKYQKKESCRVAVLSITAANTGLTLTAADSVIFAELFWNPGALVQAEDRVYRIGQKNSVIIHYLVAQGTADDYLWPLIQGKLEVLSKAGLSKDDFSSADNKTFQDPKQKSLFSYFESLMDESADADMIGQDLANMSYERHDDVGQASAESFVRSSGCPRESEEVEENDFEVKRTLKINEIAPARDKMSKPAEKVKNTKGYNTGRLWSEVRAKSSGDVNKDLCSVDSGLPRESELVSDDLGIESGELFGGTEWFDHVDEQCLQDLDRDFCEPLRKRKKL